MISKKIYSSYPVILDIDRFHKALIIILSLVRCIIKCNTKKYRTIARKSCIIFLPLPLLLKLHPNQFPIILVQYKKLLLMDSQFYTGFFHYLYQQLFAKLKVYYLISLVITVCPGINQS
jgi:hypothetical protein